MDVYQNNLNLLRYYKFELYNMYMEKKNENVLVNNVQVSNAKDGSCIFTIEKQEKSIRLNSMYRPIDEAIRWAEQFSANNVLVNALMFGFGNGMFVKCLLDRLEKDAKIFVYEPSLEIFTAALRYIDLTNIIKDSRLYLFVGQLNLNEFQDILQKYTHWTNLDSQICGCHTGYDVLFTEDYEKFINIINKINKLVKVNKDTQEFFSEKIVPNMIENLVFIRNSRWINDYIDKFPKNIPAIIVAAGPSLDKNINELTKAKGKAFILAVDTAMRQLIKRNIMPDAMVTLDAAKPFSYMNDDKIRDIPLFCELESNHDIMEFHNGIKIWFHDSIFLDKLFEHYGRVFPEYNAGGSVATAAFSICVAIGFEQIILVGQDLAYAGNVTHAGGEISHVLNEDKGIQMVDGVNGKLVKSRHDWIIYRDWFEESIQSLGNRIRVIDATEGGALIHGSEVCKLADIIDELCTSQIDVNNILASAGPVFDENEYIKVKEEIQSYLPDLVNMRILAKNAMKNCEKLIKLLKRNSQDNSIVKLNHKIIRATKEIRKYTVYDMIDIYMSKKVNKYMDGVFYIENDDRQEELKMYYKTKMIFKSVIESIEELFPLLERVLPKM